MRLNSVMFASPTKKKGSLGRESGDKDKEMQQDGMRKDLEDIVPTPVTPTLFFLFKYKGIWARILIHVSVQISIGMI